MKEKIKEQLLETKQQLQKEITERKKTEEELKKTKEKLEIQTWGLQKTNESIKLLYKEQEALHKKLQVVDQTKSDFISLVSHELRTPLTSMKNVVSNTLHGVTGAINDKLKRYLLMMNEDIDRLSRLINNLLDISRIEAGKTELKKSLVDIDALARRAISSLKPQADEKKIKLEIISPPDLEDLYVDADKLSQVFTNLIGNAIKFTPEEGEIVVAIEDKDNEIQCGVRDTGVGIPETELTKIFDKFHQVDRIDGPGTKGTGLGLPITRELIKMHNGKIWAESPPAARLPAWQGRAGESGKGSTFFFALPKTDTETVFREYLNNGLAQAKKEGTSMSLMVLTLANFDELKNKYKAKGIIRILREIEGIITKTVSSPVYLVHRHHKGEIPIVILKTGREEILSLEKKLKKAIKAHEFTLDGKSLQIEVNFGMASYPEDGEADHQLIKKLETSLKERKTYKPSIMVIDDEVDFAMVLKVRLESANYRVVVCHNEPDALEKLKKDSLPDLIILDLMLPNVDGHEMYMLLKENQKTAHIPILILSAKGERADKRLGMEFAPYNYMTKPYESQQLLAKIKEMLEKS